jgi:hypothetical protein
VPEHAQFRIASWIFVRVLGGVYAIAFGSLWVQLGGLIGSRGILPASAFLERVATQPGPERFWLAPTLGWLDASDFTLHLFCALGLLLALLVLAGWVQVVGLVVLWLLYLSLAVLGQDFLSFQWDVLLLEAGLLAVFLPGPTLRPTGPMAVRPPRLAIWLLRLLTFKVMFSSGVVKLASGDAAWRSLTALQYHYETQPLPNPVAALVHQLPGFAHYLAVVLMFAVELVAPLLIFGPPRWRRGAAGVLIALQALILLCGNFAFFNLLSIALCLLLFDDVVWLRSWRLLQPASEIRALGAVRRAVLVALAILWLVVSAVHVVGAFGAGRVVPGPLERLARGVAPWRSINPYGLFAVMTTERLEIVVEGSDDGRGWSEYRFRHKPGAIDDMPPIVAPHQPRLDWQMWFAALGSPHDQPWFLAFAGRLAQAEPAVLSLLADDPFDGRPPAFLRARLVRYRLASFSEITGGTWWRLEELPLASGVYLPATPAEELAKLAID